MKSKYNEPPPINLTSKELKIIQKIKSKLNANVEPITND